MTFGLFLRSWHKSIVKYPFLTLCASFYIPFNFIIEKAKCKKYFNFLNRIKLDIKIGNDKIRCRIPDIVVLSDVFIVCEYDLLNIIEDSIVFDIGANIGAYSVRIHNNRCKIVAVEPSSQNFILLKRNIEHNKINNVLLIYKALSDKNGYIEFYDDKSSGASSSLVKHNNNMNSYNVESIRLDDLIEQYKINVKGKKICIKLDVEGAELDILKGSEKLLQNKDVNIIMETHPSIIDPKTVKEFLERHNFNVMFLNYSQPFLLANKNSL